MSLFYKEYAENYDMNYVMSTYPHLANNVIHLILIFWSRTNIDTGLSEIWLKHVKAKQIENLHRKSWTNFDKIEIFY